MLRVKRPEMLEDLGFTNEAANYHERPIYSKEIGRYMESRIYLVVNPYEYEHERENEMQLVLEVGITPDEIKEILTQYCTESYYREFVLDLDTVFQMFARDIIEYVNDEGEQIGMNIQKIELTGKEYLSITTALQNTDDEACQAALVDAIRWLPCGESETVGMGIRYIQCLEEQERQLEAQIKALKAKQKILKRDSQQMRSGYKTFLDEIGKSRVESVLGTMTLMPGRMKICRVVDMSILPAQFVTVIPEHIEPNMAEIRRVANAGGTIPGVEITEPKKILTIR